VTRASDEGNDASTFTLRRVQAMLGLSRTIVAGLIAEGFVAPTRGKRNEWRFTFQDLMLLRTAHALQASKIPPRKILRSLARLKASLPDELPLTGLRITAIGADVAVRDRDGQWQADSGQLLMDFDVAPVAGSVAILERNTSSSSAASPDAAAWFERGVAFEATDPAGAEAAYRQALVLAPDLAEAYLNLGAMWSEAGRFAELAELSEQAVAHCQDSALIHFNRGVALDHLERLPEAMASYEQSLMLDPTLADAHYNLGRLREQLGDKRGALRHFSAYRRLQR
jgi:tetratricopeptide (TPR) repeat protein